jgi:hypothetical protein
MGKRYDAKADRGTNHLGRQYVKNSEFVAGNSSTFIPKGDIVTLSGVDGVYPTVERARDGVTEETQLFVAATEIRGDVGLIELWAIETDVDTSGAAADGDPIYLSDATPGQWTVTAPAGSPITVGKVLVKHASTGAVLIRPLV